MRIYVRLILSGEGVGTEDVIYGYINVENGCTADQIDNAVYEAYVDRQIDWYETYNDYADYCDANGYDADSDDAWDEYRVHVLELGSYEILDHEPEDDEMDDSIYGIEEL